MLKGIETLALWEGGARRSCREENYSQYLWEKLKRLTREGPFRENGTEGGDWAQQARKPKRAILNVQE